MIVYEPREDSYLLAEQVKKYAKGKVLDMGCGSGIQAETALKKAEEVLAVDINEDAVKLTRRKGINAKVSDLFENIKGKFDLIIFNPPYLPGDSREDKQSKTATTGGKQGNEIIKRFFSEAKDYLNKNGKILIVFSSITPDVDEIIKENGFKFKCLKKKRFFFETLFVYLCY